MADVKKIGDILKQFDPLEDKYISREFQSYGIYLAEELDDVEHKALYIKLARDVPRVVLEKTLSFVKIQDQGKVKSKAKLFMWKLKELGAFNSSAKLKIQKSPPEADQPPAEKLKTTTQKSKL